MESPEDQNKKFAEIMTMIMIGAFLIFIFIKFLFF
jgi:hypothetical protein